MIPYLILIFIPLFFNYVCLRKQRERSVIAIGTNREIQDNSLLIPMFFVLYFLILSLRHESIGADIFQYKIKFEQLSKMNLSQALDAQGDVLYNVLTWLISRFTHNYRVFLVLIAAIILLPIAIFYAEDREYGFLKMIIFINMPNFIMIFSGLRQAVAFSVGIIAYKYVREKKLWWFLFLALIAMGIHHSGFLVFSLYPLYHANFKKKHLWFVIPAIIFVYVFNEQIFGVAVGSLIMIFGEDYSAELTDTGAYTMLILFILFAVFSYILPDEEKMDKETLGLRNILLAAIVLQCFVPLNQLAMRLNYYYLVFIPVLIPKIIKCCKRSLWQYGRLANWAISIYFLVYYLDKLYISCSTGISSLRTYPYLFFWQ